MAIHLNYFSFWQANRELNDPENALIGAFAGNNSIFSLVFFYG